MRQPQTWCHPFDCRFGHRVPFCAKFALAFAKFYDEFNAHPDQRAPGRCNWIVIGKDTRLFVRHKLIASEFGHFPRTRLLIPLD